MNTFKTILLILVATLEISLNVWAAENDAVGHPITSQTTELLIPFAEMDDVPLIQYALQLQKTKPKLFAGAQGVLILEVELNSQAERKGLRRGDIIVAYNGQQMDSAQQLINTMQTNMVESQVKLQFIRGNAVQKIVLKGGNIGIHLTNMTEELTKEVFSWYRRLIRRLNKEAKKAFYHSEYSNALKKWEQALYLAHQIKNQRAIGTFIGNIGLTYRGLGQYLKALDYYQRALIINKVNDDKDGISSNLFNIGVAYQGLYDNSKALSYHQQALIIDKETDDKHGISRNLFNIGAAHRKLGNYPKALDFLLQALIIDKESDDKQGMVIMLTWIGVIYKNLGDYPKALDYYQQALTISKEFIDKRFIMDNLNNIGNINLYLGNYSKALDYYRQVLKIGKKIGNKLLERDKIFANKLLEGTILTNIGSIYLLSFGNYLKALNYYQLALAILKEVDAKHEQGINWTNIGLAYQYLGKYQKAKNAFQNSAVFLAMEPNNLWRAQRGLASTEVKLNQPKLAIEYYEQALDNIEKLRILLTEKEHKIFFMHNKLFVYDELIALLQSLHPKYPDKGYDRKALTIFERKQGRVFLEEMGKSGAWRFGGVPEETSRKDREFEQKIAAARKDRTEALEQGKDAEPHRKRLEKLLVKQQPFEKMLAEDYPKYYALKYPKPVSLAILQNELLQPGEMMLVYNVMEKRIALWVIGKHQFQMLTLDISEEELQDKVNAFRQSPNCLIEAIEEFPKEEIPYIAAENLPILRQASYELYQLLMPKKVKTLLKDTRTLYIVPTGSLYGLPFGALDTHKPAQHDKPHYLIQDYPIAYLSSASLLKTIRIQEPQEDNRYPFLAFADPEYPEKCPLKPDNVTEVIQTARTKTYLKLAGSEKEQCFTKEDELKETGEQAEAICHLLKEPENNNSLQLGNKASRSNVFDFHNKERLNKYKYVLFAAHAVLPNEISHINQSAIVLSNPDTEGYLTMADVFGLQMNADLVFLSACNTGGGKEIKGEGIRGLTRAFMYAGTPAVSVSLWKVASSSAKKLSIGLFEYLQAGKPLAQALRQSKLDLMANEDMEIYQHPFFWAPFVVFGDGS